MICAVAAKNANEQGWILEQVKIGEVVLTFSRMVLATGSFENK